MLNHLNQAATAHLSEFAAAAMRIGWKWCLFGGAAVSCYGGDRPIRDIDVVTDASPWVVTRVLSWPLGGNGVPVTTTDPQVEVWPSPLVFESPARTVLLPLDADVLARRRFLLGWQGKAWSCMGPEDLLLIKAVQQRGAEQDKHDIEDLITLLDVCGDALDWPYFWSRVTGPDLIARVEGALAVAGIQNHGRPMSSS